MLLNVLFPKSSRFLSYLFFHFSFQKSLVLSLHPSYQYLSPFSLYVCLYCHCTKVYDVLTTRRVFDKLLLPHTATSTHIHRSYCKDLLPTKYPNVPCHVPVRGIKNQICWETPGSHSGTADVVRCVEWYQSTRCYISEDLNLYLLIVWLTEWSSGKVEAKIFDWTFAACSVTWPRLLNASVSISWNLPLNVR